MRWKAPKLSRERGSDVPLQTIADEKYACVSRKRRQRLLKKQSRRFYTATLRGKNDRLEYREQTGFAKGKSAGERAANQTFETTPRPCERAASRKNRSISGAT